MIQEETVLYSHLASTNSDTSEERLARLRQHQNREAVATRQRLAQLTGIREDYEALRARLQTVTDTTCHQVMVPFTKVAYFPGKLVHTNEIVCLLGDNWFVERSAKQAIEIVDRRLKMCNDSIKQIEDSTKLLDNWKEQTEKFQSDLKATQGVNIVEEESDDSWREIHREKVREYKRKLAELRNKDEAPKEKTFDDVLRMLDERELEEELRDELSKLDEEYEEEEDNQLEHEDDEIVEMEEDMKEVEIKEEDEEKEEEEKKKSVRWSQELDAVKQFKRDELIAKSPLDGVLRLTFTHTADQRKTRFAEEKQQLDDDPNGQLVKSPADIFSKYGPGGCVEFSRALDEPKSILKVKKSTTPVLTDKLQRFDDDVDGPDGAQKQQQQQQQTLGPPPVGDQVRERETNVPETNANTHRPLSRFKAARQHKKL